MPKQACRRENMVHSEIMRPEGPQRSPLGGSGGMPPRKNFSKKGSNLCNLVHSGPPFMGSDQSYFLYKNLFFCPPHPMKINLINTLYAKKIASLSHLIVIRHL